MSICNLQCNICIYIYIHNIGITNNFKAISFKTIFLKINNHLQQTYNFHYTPLKFNIARKNRQSEKETHLPTIIFRGLCWISRVYISSNLASISSFFWGSSGFSTLKLLHLSSRSPKPTRCRCRSHLPYLRLPSHHQDLRPWGKTVKYGEKKQTLPSRELTYPTWGKGKSSSKVPFYGIC